MVTFAKQKRHALRKQISGIWNHIQHVQFLSPPQNRRFRAEGHITSPRYLYAVALTCSNMYTRTLRTIPSIGRRGFAQSGTRVSGISLAALLSFEARWFELGRSSSSAQMAVFYATQGVGALKSISAANAYLLDCNEVTRLASCLFCAFIVLGEGPIPKKCEVKSI